MRIEIGTLDNGGVILACKPALDDVVRRVEYYRDQRLFMLVFHKGDLGDYLIPYEIPEDFEKPVDRSPNVMIFSLFDDHEPVGYKAPLVKVGDFY